MYYKITNKESTVYKKLHEMRTKEIQMAKNNLAAIKKKIGLKFKDFLGYAGQQNFRRVTQYSGFCFTEPENVDLKVWKKAKDEPTAFVPNRKTTAGRQMAYFLNNELEGGSFNKVFQILNIEYGGRFSFPFVAITKDVVIVYLDNKHIPKSKDLIEITSVEFKKLQKKAK